MTATSCEACRRIFMADGLLQAEMRHLALTQGAGVAESELNERLADEHGRHSWLCLSSPSPKEGT